MSLERHRNPALWTQVTIHDAALTGGIALSRFIESLLSVGDFTINDVVVAGIDGAGDPVRGVTQLGCVRLPREELLRRLRYSVQLDWANFFFTTDSASEAADFICQGAAIPDAIEISELTIRVIDDAEAHVFTRNDAVIAWLNKLGSIAEFRTDRLSMLEYPS